MICNMSANHAMSVLFTGKKYAALFSDDPTQAGLFTNEMVGGSYVRKPVTFSTPNARSVVTEGSDVLWWADLPEIPIRYIGICNAVSGGQLIAYQLVSATGVIIPDGYRFVVATGDLAFTLN